MTPLTALVVAHRGGEALAATLTSVAWAGRRCVADPARGVPADGWPAGVERWPVADVGGWILLLAEGEVVCPEFAAAVEKVRDERAGAYRIAVECHAFGGAIRLRGRPVRLLRGAPPEVRVGLGGEIGFAVDGAASGLAGAVVARRLPSLPGEAIDALNAEASTLAALAAARDVRPRGGRLVAGGVLGATRVLFGAGRGRLGWGRWIAAGLAGYRGLLAEAKLWERCQLGVTPRS